MSNAYEQDAIVANEKYTNLKKIFDETKINQKQEITLYKKNFDKLTEVISILKEREKHKTDHYKKVFNKLDTDNKNKKKEIIDLNSKFKEMFIEFNKVKNEVKIIPDLKKQLAIAKGEITSQKLKVVNLLKKIISQKDDIYTSAVIAKTFKEDNETLKQEKKSLQDLWKETKAEMSLPDWVLVDYMLDTEMALPDRGLVDYIK